jgi:hypothetical protein
VSRSNNGQLAGVLTSTLHLDWTMQHYVDQAQKIKDLTVDEMNKAVAKWIEPKRLVVVEAGILRSRHRRLIGCGGAPWEGPPGPAISRYETNWAAVS